MRVFLAACLAVIILALGTYFSLNTMQRSSSIAFATEGARIDPSWAAHPDGTL